MSTHDDEYYQELKQRGLSQEQDRRIREELDGIRKEDPAPVAGG